MQANWSEIYKLQPVHYLPPVVLVKKVAGGRGGYFFYSYKDAVYHNHHC